MQHAPNSTLFWMLQDFPTISCLQRVHLNLLPLRQYPGDRGANLSITSQGPRSCPFCSAKILSKLSRQPSCGKWSTTSPQNFGLDENSNLYLSLVSAVGRTREWSVSTHHSNASNLRGRSSVMFFTGSPCPSHVDADANYKSSQN